MTTINASTEVNARLEEIWLIVSNVDNDPKYWNGLNSIRNFRKEGNVVEREVEVGLRHSRGVQRITLNPNQSVDLEMTDGPMIGSRIMRLTPLSDGRKTKIDVTWNFVISPDVPSFARGFLLREIEGGTKKALEKIGKEAQKHNTSSIAQSNQGELSIQNSENDGTSERIGSEATHAV
jgi:hypothetical protein